MHLLKKTIKVCVCGKSKKSKTYSTGQLATGTLLLSIVIGAISYFYTGYFALIFMALLVLVVVFMALFYYLKGHRAFCATRQAAIRTLANASDFMSFS